MTTAKRVGGFQSFGWSVLTTTKVFRKLIQLYRVHFHHCKSCRRLALVHNYVFSTVKRVESAQSFGECDLVTAKRVGGLQRFVECVFSTTKRVGGLQSFRECVFPLQSM